MEMLLGLEHIGRKSKALQVRKRCQKWKECQEYEPRMKTMNPRASFLAHSLPPTIREGVSEDPDADRP